MSPSDFNLWEMGSSGKSRSVFSSVHPHHSRNGPGNVPWLKCACLAGFGEKKEFTFYFWSTSKLQSFQPALDLKLKFLDWGNLAHFAMMGRLPWASLHCRASQSTCKPGLPGSCCKVTKLGSFGQTLFLAEIFYSGVWAKICWYLQHKRCLVFLLLEGPKVRFFLGKCWYSNLFFNAKSFSNPKITSQTTSKGQNFILWESSIVKGPFI